MCKGTLHSRLPLVLAVALEDLLASCPAKEMLPSTCEHMSAEPSGCLIQDYAGCWPLWVTGTGRQGDSAQAFRDITLASSPLCSRAGKTPSLQGALRVLG